VKTLAEIEAAVESLPQDKTEELLRFIKAFLAGGKRNFPVSKGHIPITSADVARIESEFDETH
jgi:hypothetical protein